MTVITFPQLGKLGRLGNTLFQCASTIGIASKNNLFFFFPEWENQKYFINKLPTKDDIKIELRPYKTIGEDSFSYKDFTLSDHYNYEIKNSYLQSYKYWEPHASHLIKKYFEFQPNLIDKIKKVWYTSLVSNLVTVHVRLSDYVQFSDYHTNLQLTDYYKDATNLIKAQLNGKITLIVCSDNIEWCKGNFSKLLDSNISRFEILFSDSQSAVEDLVLQTLVNHNIIANSTFSYFGAYLNKNESKMIITPGGIKYPWFGAKSPHDTKDLIPKDWIKL